MSREAHGSSGSRREPSAPDDVGATARPLTMSVPAIRATSATVTPPLTAAAPRSRVTPREAATTSITCSDTRRDTSIRRAESTTGRRRRQRREQHPDTPETPDDLEPARRPRPRREDDHHDRGQPISDASHTNTAGDHGDQDHSGHHDRRLGVGHRRPHPHGRDPGERGHQRRVGSPKDTGRGRHRQADDHRLDRSDDRLLPQHRTDQRAHQPQPSTVARGATPTKAQRQQRSHRRRQ